VTEGIAIANALRSHPANVTVQVDGIAASIASVIAMAGDRVRMMPNALLMVHEASGICAGDSAEMIKMAEVLDKISGNIADAYAVKAGGTRDDWRQVMKDETWYTAEEAVKAGLADEMVSARKQQAESEPDAPEMAARFDLAAYGYHGPAQPEAPKPGPPPMKAQTGEPAPPIALTISLGEALGEQLVTAVRAAVTPSVSAEPVGTGRQAEANAAGPEPSPLDAGLAAPNDPEPTPWAAAFAPLTTPQPDPWAAAFAPLTTGPASSSATES
jgi:ClpP class serine protease